MCKPYGRWPHKDRPGDKIPLFACARAFTSMGSALPIPGKNGAGKTTLVKVLAGLYQPSAGQISVDGKDPSQIDPQTWRNRLGAVLQDYSRYQTTVQENIGFGDLERLEDRAALEAAALRSGANEVIAQLGAGYETHLGTTYHPQGCELSVGQWQKLALARAYLRQKAQLLVLDEPTAALDPKAEVEVYRQFLDISQNRSVLLISHRLGSARLADRILFLADGKIVETGTHDELMAQKGRYAELFSVQAEWYQ